MTPSCAVQCAKPAAGSISRTTVEPLVSALQFVLPTEMGNGAIMIDALPGTLNPVSLTYFLITFPAIFDASLSLNGQAPLTTTSNVFEVLRSERPTKNMAFSGATTSYCAS